MTALPNHLSPEPVHIAPQPRVLTIPDAGAMLGIGRATAYRLAKSGDFPVRILKLGSRRLVSRAELDRFINGDVDAPTD